MTTLRILPLIAVFAGLACGDSASSSDASTSTPGASSEGTNAASTSETTAPTMDPRAWCDDDGECEEGEIGCLDCSLCWNERIDPGEECDDGNNDNTDGCVDNCRLATCGDGHIQQGVETCDEGAGNLASTDYDKYRHCSSGPDEAQACKGYAPHCGDGGGCMPEDDAVGCTLDCPSATPMPVCGNMMVEEGEACDVGMADDAMCNRALAMNNQMVDVGCRRPVCGDGYHNTATAEQCDDGPDGDNTDGCVLGCKLAVCGDGVVHSAEGCDDGNADETDECDSECRPIRKLFVTTGKYSGGQIGGVLGANAECNALAGAAGLRGPFRAWISDSLTSPSTTFDTLFMGSYRLVDGTLVAVGWTGLTGVHEAPLDRDEAGEPIDSTIFTNTRPDGTSASAMNCTDWTSGAGTTYVGASTAMDDTWTQSLNTPSCGGGRSLYCVEDK